MSRSVTIPAYAKVNLHLDVLAKRPDGTHELITLFERIDLADRVTVEETADSRIELCCGYPDVPQDRTNLVVRAAEAYREASGWSAGLRITLEKRIPVAGGLGGGSSDAAATLLALQELTGHQLSPPDLFRVAKGLGADVPFFLADAPWALGTGRGDEIEPLDLNTRLWHLLVSPSFTVPTKAVYQAFSLTGPGPDVKLLYRALRDNHVGEVRDLLFNALEPTVEALYPAIRDVKAVIQTEAKISKPMVSGTGSTVMAVCVSHEEATAAAEVLKRQNPQWQLLVAATKV